jgi:LacI family transcriptional regulator
MKSVPKPEPKRSRAPRKKAAKPAATEVEAKSGRAITINDIARLAGVSKKTVSRVLNQSPLIREGTRSRVQAVIEREKYQPDPQARGLAFRRSFLIGVVYDNPNAQYIVNSQQGALDALRGTDFELVVHPCDRRNPQFVASVRKFAERLKLWGVILLPPVSENNELTRELAAIGCRYVRVSYGPLDTPERVVATNDRVAVREAADYLVSLGHRCIGFISGPSGYMSAGERRTGFSEALQAHGLRLPAPYIVEGGYTYDSGVACANLLLSRRPRPTAIFASNDEMAAGVYRSAHKLGLSIPEDLSIIGFDDGPLAERMLPSLTTVRLPIRDIGRRAAERLIGAAIETPSLNPLVPHLVVRDSCARPRKSG